VTILARDEEGSQWRHQLFDVKVSVLFASAVATIQFVDRRVVDAESAVGCNEFIVDDEFGHGSHARGRTGAIISFTTM
jgi:hypothetical protein